MSETEQEQTQDVITFEEKQLQHFNEVEHLLHRIASNTAIIRSDLERMREDNKERGSEIDQHMEYIASKIKELGAAVVLIFLVLLYVTLR